MLIYPPARPQALLLLCGCVPPEWPGVKGLHLLNVAVRSQLARRSETDGTECAGQGGKGISWRHGVKGARGSMYTGQIAKTERDT